MGIRIHSWRVHSWAFLFRSCFAIINSLETMITRQSKLNLFFHSANMAIKALMWSLATRYGSWYSSFTQEQLTLSYHRLQSTYPCDSLRSFISYVNYNVVDCAVKQTVYCSEIDYCQKNQCACEKSCEIDIT